MFACKSIQKTQNKVKDSSRTETSAKVDSSANTVTKDEDSHAKVGNVDLQIKGTGKKGTWEKDSKSKGPVSDLIKEAGKVSDATGSDVRLIIGDFDMKYSSKEKAQSTDYRAESREKKSASTSVSTKDVETVSVLPGFSIMLYILILIVLSLILLDKALNQGNVTARLISFVKNLFKKRNHG
jgi:hypothetical protein